jgi:hypothetical protein
MGEIKTELKIWYESLKERYHLEYLGVNRKIILKWILGRRWEIVDWTYLAQERDL